MSKSNHKVKRAPIISVTNQKGGVGKTTMLSTLASILTERGYNVLSINLDPQRNLDMMAGREVAIKINDTESLGILQVLRDGININDTIVQTPLGDLIRASSLLSGWTGSRPITESEFERLKNNPNAVCNLLTQRFAKLREIPDNHILRERLKDLRGSYDYIFLDTNPSLMLLTMNALYAADYVLIPVFTDDFSRTALGELWNTIQNINYYEPSKQLRVAGLVVTKSNNRTLVARKYYSSFKSMADKMGTVLFDTKIRQSVAASEATAMGRTIVQHAPRDAVADDYRRLADEFVKRMEALKHGKKV